MRHILFCIMIIVSLINMYHHDHLDMQVRREKISERMKLLQDLVPGCSKAIAPFLKPSSFLHNCVYIKHLHCKFADKWKGYDS